MTPPPATLLAASRRIAAAGAAPVATRVGLGPVASKRAGEPSGAAEAWLVDGSAAAHPVGLGTRLGRDALLADLVVVHDSVSRCHAELRRARSGGFVLADLGSTNGSFVDGRRVRGEAPLGDGALVGLGMAALVFVAAPGAGHTIDARPAAPREVTLCAAATRAGAEPAGVAALDDVQVELVGRVWQAACALATRWLADASQAPAERGWLRRAALIDALHPRADESGEALVHVTLRRLERSLAPLVTAAGGAVLERSDRLGCRMRVAPSPQPAP